MARYLIVARLTMLVVLSLIITPGLAQTVPEEANSPGALIAAGELDPTFDSDGKVLTSFSPNSQLTAAALVIQPDGRLVVAGTDAGVSLLARYNRDGSLDTSFDTDGHMTSSLVQVRALVLQPDGKIVVGGTAWIGNAIDFALVRYNSDGSLDPTFGVNGRVTTDFLGGGDTAVAMVLQPDGKLVAAGTVFSTPEPYPSSFGLARYWGDSPATIYLPMLIQ